MEIQMDMDASSATVDEISSDAQPVASSTPENEQSLSALRRSCRKKPSRAPCADHQTGIRVRCFTNITGRRPIHTPRESKSRGSLRNTRKSRGSANEAPELPMTSHGLNSELNLENSLVLPEKRQNKTKAVADGLSGNHSEVNAENSLVLPEKRQKQTRVFASCLPRNFGPVTRRRSLLGLAIAAAKRKVEECGEISFTISDPANNTITGLKESAPKRARVEKQNSDMENDQGIRNGLRENEINVTLAGEAAISKEPELKNDISDVNGISNSIRLIRLDENKAKANGISTQKEVCSMKEVTPETNRISNSLEDFSREQNMPQANEQSSSSKSFLIKDTVPAADKMPNLMREFKTRENMPQNDLQLKENTNETNEIPTPKGEVKISGIEGAPTAVPDITMSVQRRDTMPKNTSTPILSNLVDNRPTTRAILTVSEGRIQMSDDNSNLQQSKESILPNQDTRTENQSNEEADENVTHRGSAIVQDQREEEENPETEEQVTHVRSPENSNETPEAGNSRCNIM